MIKALAVAALLISLPAAALAQEKPCIPQEDAKAAILFALPRAMDGARESCGARLPATAFLNTGAQAYAARLKAAHPESWRSIGPVVASISGSDIFADLSPETVAAMSSDLLTKTLAKEIKPETCPQIDQLASNLSRLPENELANTILLIFQLADKPGENGKTKPSLCPADPS